MKIALLTAFLISCAHQTPELRPGWVDSVRSGEETLKVVHGSKTYYRRIAGSSAVSKQTSCNLVIMKAEEDLKKEFPDLAKIPYAVEVLFYDVEHQDCAVTISVANNLPVQREVASEEVAIEDEASALVNIRSELAMKFALTGLTKPEFEKFAKDKVQIINEENLCSPYFKTNSYSIHGLTHVCWKGDIIAGYCTTKDKQCWTRTP